MVHWASRALAGSIAVHAALAVAASRWHHHDRDPIVLPETADDTSIEVSAEAPAPPPVAIPVPIELVTIKTPPAAIIAQPAPRGTAAGRPIAAPAAAISTGQRTVGPETTAPEPPGSRQLSMRDPIRRPDGAALADTIERIAEQGTPPPPIPHSGRIEHEGRDVVINDRTFTAQVEPDGTVHIDDKPNFNAHIAVPSPKAMGKAIADWAEDPYGYVEKLPQPGDMIETAPRGDRARLTPQDQKPDQGGTVPLIGGGFDVTDWIARKALGKAKGDPYAARKRAALDATIDERAEMRRVHRNEQLEHADDFARDSLERLWSSDLPLDEKKEDMFELWDDCAESGDAPVVAAAVRARRVIVAFIALKLPPGSAGAFSEAELAALNAHKSSAARFDPYAPPDQGK